MKLAHAHPWNLSPKEAVAVQKELCRCVKLRPLPRRVTRVAGLDAGYAEGKARAAVVVLGFPDLEPLERRTASLELCFPYVPGLLSFREAPAALAALQKLERLPDVLIVDGQGLAHPRRFGIACHVGVLLDLPTVGCAKSILTGRHGRLGRKRGSTAELLDDGELIGMAVRTRDDVRPVFVSPGHRADVPSAVELVLRCCRGYRLPEPTRQADKLASRR